MSFFESRFDAKTIEGVFQKYPGARLQFEKDEGSILKASLFLKDGQVTPDAVCYGANVGHALGTMQGLLGGIFDRVAVRELAGDL